MSEVNVPLALHCLAGGGKFEDHGCPIIRERTFIMKEGVCDGLSIVDQMFEWLVQAMLERNPLEQKIDKDNPKRKHVVAYARADAQVAVLSYSIALIRNPYNPDPEAVLLDAEMDATVRSEAVVES